MENPSFFLEGVVREKNEMQDFEGPLSLILMLLQKNKIEIRDISVSDILDQYLEYLDRMEKMDLEIASEFVQMAAHLLYIKTKTLIAGDEEVSELELLMSSLEQLQCRELYAAVQKVTPELKKASELGLLYYAKLPEPPPETAREYGYRHDPVDLLSALYGLYVRGARPVEPADELAAAIPRRIVYSVRDKSRELLDRLRRGDASLNELYAACASRSEVVATFVAVLELCSMGSVRLKRREEGWYAGFTGGDIEEILDNIAE